MVDQKNTSRLDPRSGKMISVKPAEELNVPPDPREVTAIEKVAGKNPPVTSLRDHQDWVGMDLYVTDVAFGEGDINGKHTEYFIASCFICPPGRKPTKDDFVLLRTGSDNVYKRIAEAFAKGALPVKGTLRRGGKAWFLD